MKFMNNDLPIKHEIYEKSIFSGSRKKPHSPNSAQYQWSVSIRLKGRLSRD
jgi:hypothetical protein